MIQNYIQEFNQQASTGVVWLDQLRQNSMAKFEKTGFPTQRIEEWKDTNISSISGKYFKSPNQKTTLSSPPDRTLWNKNFHIAFVNGFCEPIDIKIPGLVITKLSDAIETLTPELQDVMNLKLDYEHSMMDLNTSMVREGVVIQVEQDAHIEEPIYLIYQSDTSGEAFYYRNLILANRSSKIKIVEVFLSENESWTIPVTQIQTMENASVEHVLIQAEGLDSSHTGIVVGKLGKNSSLSTLSFVYGGKITRNDISMNLDGEGSSCVMDGIYAVSNSQTVDHHTCVNHSKPNCNSFENYRGVLMDQAHGIFQGKIFVAQDAQKTDAKQMNQNLLLSASAKVNTAPQLEILADDVKCSHGATIGKLDEAQIFYLRTRGIELSVAQQMLVSAYADEVISKISIPELQSELSKMLSAKIGVV